VGSCRQWLDSTLDEDSHELDARKPFLGVARSRWIFSIRGSVIFISSSESSCLHDTRGPKFFKPEVFATGEFVFGIKPLCPPTSVVFRCLKIEVRDIRAHLAAEATSLIVQGAPDDEDAAPKRPMGLNPQKTLTEHDETRDVQNRIGIQIMELNPIRKEKAVKKRVRGKRKSPEDESKKDYPEAWGRPGDDLWTRGEGLRRIILQNADLLGARQLLVSDLSLDPIADDGGISVLGFGPLSGDAGSGTGRGRASFAHGGGAQ
jgi:hypothetical protein